jgi:hypothetical protein
MANSINVENYNTILDSYLSRNPDKAGYQQLSEFLGFKQNIFADPALSGNYGFVFVTKPALFIYPIESSSGNKSVAYTNMIKDRLMAQYTAKNNTNPNDLYIAKSLSYETFNDAPSLFLPIFTNCTRAISTTDTTLDTIESFQTKEGFRIPLPNSTTQSEAAGSISISMNETANLDIFKTIEMWIEYMACISNGTFSANPDMVKNNMLDFTSSIYYFMLAPDGRTIKYWCRYTSAMPTSYPTSVFSYQRGQADFIQPDIPFSYTLKEEKDPQLLEDFNLVSLRKVTPTFTESEFATLAATDSSGYFDPISSNYLKKTSVLSMAGSLKNRDPVVYYEPDTSATKNSYGKSSGHYVLSFGDDSISDPLHKAMSSSADYLMSLLSDDK